MTQGTKTKALVAGGGIIAAIPLGVLVTFLTTAGEYKARVETTQTAVHSLRSEMEHCVAKMEEQQRRTTDVVTALQVDLGRQLARMETSMSALSASMIEVKADVRELRAKGERLPERQTSGGR